MRSAVLWAVAVAVAVAPGVWGGTHALPPAVEERGEAVGHEAGRRIAITVDDLPISASERWTTDRQRAITDRLLATLERHQAPAIGFVNEGKLVVDGRLDPGRVELLERWLEAGFELGNHGFSHLDLHRVPIDEFLEDVVRGEEVTRALAEARGRPLRYFRHPYLHTGRDLETKAAVEGFLAERGYAVAPVTVDNSEWIFARAYDEALESGDETARGRIADAYVAYMEAMVAYYEDQSRTVLGGEIPQVLLLHANALNADHLGRLLDRLDERGYRFVTLGEALEHPVFGSDDEYVGPAGITWIHRWAITAGADRALFAGEPRTPAWVQELAGVSE